MSQLTHYRGQRGAVLPFALIILAALTVALVALIDAQNTKAKMVDVLRADREAELLQASAAAALEGAALQAIRHGSLTGAQTLASNAMADLSTEHWGGVVLSSQPWVEGPSFDGSATPPVNALLYQRDAVLTQLTPTPPSMRWLDDTVAVRRYRYTTAVSLLPRSTPDNPSPSPKVTNLTLTVVEVPTVAFAFVATSLPFNESDSNTQVSVTGTALFNGGVNRLAGANPTVSVASVVLAGATTDNLKNLNASPGSAGMVATWGLAPDWSGYLSLGGGTGNTPQVSRCDASIGGLSTVNWDVLALDPTPLPYGIQRLVVDNLPVPVPRLVIDLAQFVGATHLHIQCSDATKGGGVVLNGAVGAGAESLAAVSITTNGQVTLWGDNDRVVFAATSYTGPVGLMSASYGGGGAATNMSWRGYLHVISRDVVLSSPDNSENWSNAQLTLKGTFAYLGGSLKGVGRLQCVRDDVVRGALSLGSTGDASFFGLPRSDRAAFVTVNPH